MKCAQVTLDSVVQVVSVYMWSFFTLMKGTNKLWFGTRCALAWRKLVISALNDRSVMAVHIETSHVVCQSTP